VDARTQQLLKFCQTVGGPLLAAACAREGDAAKAAQATALLLSRTATVGADIGRTVGVAADDPGARLAIAGVAATLVAGLYDRSGAVPDDAAMGTIAQALTSVATFAQGFEGADAAAPLPGPAAIVAALAPAVDAIAAAPMDARAEDVGKKIVDAARALAETLGGDASVGLGLVRPLAEVYAACHAAAAKGQGGDAAAAWAAFEMRTTMLQTLARGLAEGGAAPASPAAPKTPEPPAQKAPLPIRRSPAAGKGAAPAAPPKAGGSPANPMGFFAKKKPEPPAESPPPEAEPESQSAPPQSPDEEDAAQGGESGPPANPMGFFKKKRPDDDGQGGQE
jgi:hypothetical protein